MVHSKDLIIISTGGITMNALKFAVIVVIFSQLGACALLQQTPAEQPFSPANPCAGQADRIAVIRASGNVGCRKIGTPSEPGEKPYVAPGATATKGSQYSAPDVK